MLVSDIACLVFIAVSFFLFLVGIGVWVDWAWNHRVKRAKVITGCIILAVVVLAMVIGTIVSLAVIL